MDFVNKPKPAGAELELPGSIRSPNRSKHFTPDEELTVLEVFMKATPQFLDCLGYLETYSPLLVRFGLDWQPYNNYAQVAVLAEELEEKSYQDLVHCLREAACLRVNPARLPANMLTTSVFTMIRTPSHSWIPVGFVRSSDWAGYLGELYCADIDTQLPDPDVEGRQVGLWDFSRRDMGVARAALLRSAFDSLAVPTIGSLRKL